MRGHLPCWDTFLCPIITGFTVYMISTQDLHIVIVLLPIYIVTVKTVVINIIFIWW